MARLLVLRFEEDPSDQVVAAALNFFPKAHYAVVVEGSKKSAQPCRGDLTPRRLYSEYRRHTNATPVLDIRDN